MISQAGTFWSFAEKVSDLRKIFLSAELVAGKPAENLSTPAPPHVDALSRQKSLVFTAGPEEYRASDF